LKSLMSHGPHMRQVITPSLACTGAPGAGRTSTDARHIPTSAARTSTSALIVAGMSAIIAQTPTHGDQSGASTSGGSGYGINKSTSRQDRLASPAQGNARSARIVCEVKP
jgi:hypothetical protein